MGACCDRVLLLHEIHAPGRGLTAVRERSQELGATTNRDIDQPQYRNSILNTVPIFPPSAALKDGIYLLRSANQTHGDR